MHLDHVPQSGEALPLDPIVLVAHNIGTIASTSVGLRLPEDEELRHAAELGKDADAQAPASSRAACDPFHDVR